jgi:hypothetical protein
MEKCIQDKFNSVFIIKIEMCHSVFIIDENVSKALFIMLYDVFNKHSDDFISCLVINAL